MHHSGLRVVGLATLVVLAGCNGVFGTPTPTDSSSPNNSSSSASSLQELENATMWIDGTVQRIENNTVYIDDQPYSKVVIPVQAKGPSFYCQAKNGSGANCEPVQLNEIQQGEDVCAFVRVESGTVQVVKVFFNMVCGGPQVPQQ